MTSRILLILALIINFNSLQAQNNPTLCKSPEALTASARESIASLNWHSTGTNSTYMVQWKSVHATEWNTKSPPTNSFSLSGLQPCSEYEFRVKTVCSTTLSSEYGATHRFKTLGCNSIMPCATPREVKGEGSENKIFFKWASTEARGYEVNYQDATNNGEWIKAIVNTNSFTALNLKPCTKYFFKVRSICSNATIPTAVLYSEWSSQIVVATTGCGTGTRCEPLRKLNISVASTGTILKWEAVAGATYDVQFKKLNDIEWTTIPRIQTNFHTFLNLPTCSVYETRVRVNCNSTTSSSWSHSTRFVTPGCHPICVTPRAVKVTVMENSAVVSWVSTQAGKFNLQFKEENGTVWTSIPVEANIRTLSGLTPCKKYYVRVQSICTTSSSSDFSEVVKFETRGCIAPSTCEVPGNLKSALTADNIVVLSFTGSIGNTNPANTSFEIQYRIAGSGDAGWKSTGPINLEKKLELEKCKTYEWKARKICSTNSMSDWSAIAKFETKGCVAPTVCEVPSNLKSALTADNIVVLSFTGSIGNTNPANTGFEIQYRIAGSGDAGWKSTSPINLEKKLELEKCKTYEWKVRKICSATSTSDWSAISKFETRGCVAPTACPTPLNVKIVMVAEGVSVTWSDRIENHNAVVQYAGPSDANYHQAIGTTPNGVILRGLQACATYKFRIVRKCTNGTASVAYETTFKIAGTNCISKGDDNNLMGQLVSRITAKNVGISPNPGSDFIQVQYDLDEISNVKIQLLNLQGQVVKQLDGGNQEMGSYMKILDNLTDIQTGMYFLVVRTNGHVISTQKWMKQ